MTEARGLDEDRNIALHRIADALFELAAAVRDERALPHDHIDNATIAGE